LRGGFERLVCYSVFAVSVLSAALRLYPSILTGIPYNTDSWAPMANTREILEHSPTPLRPGRYFDDYNIYWPLVSLYSSVATLVTGLDLISASAIFVPLAGSLSVILLYAVAARVTRDWRSATLAATLLAASGFHAIITAGAKKETIAWPLHIAALYLFLSGELSWRWGISMVLVGTALTAAHHLALLATLAPMLAMTATCLIVSGERIHEIRKWRISASTLLLAISVPYYALHALRGLGKYPMTAQVAISLLAYQGVMLLPLAVSLVKFERGRQRVPTKAYLILIPLAAGLVLLASQKSLVPGIPHLPIEEVTLILPYAPIVAAAAAGAILSQRCMPAQIWGDLGSWAASLLALEGFALFGVRYGGLTYRLVNFALVPLFIYAGLAISRLRLRRALPWLLAALIAISMVLPMYATTSVRTRYFGSQNHYNAEDLALAHWIGGRARENVSVSGDQKVAYLLRYFGVKTSPWPAFSYLSGLDPTPEFDCLVVYREMARGGYHLVQVGIELPDGWWTLPVADSKLALVYENGEDRMLARP